MTLLPRRAGSGRVPPHTSPGLGWEGGGVGGSVVAIPWVLVLVGPGGGVPAPLKCDSTNALCPGPGPGAPQGVRPGKGGSGGAVAVVPGAPPSPRAGGAGLCPGARWVRVTATAWPGCCGWSWARGWGCSCPGGAPGCLCGGRLAAPPACPCPPSSPASPG